MTFSISIDDNIKDMQRQLTKLERTVLPKATSKALTFTAERAQKEISNTIRQVFKSPKKFTQNAFKKKFLSPNGRSSINGLGVLIFLKDIHAVRDHYLKIHIDGGARPMRRSEERLGFYFAISKSFGRSGFSNGLMSKILADVGAFNQRSGDASNTRSKALGGKKRIKYFIRGSKGNRIVYEKFGRGFKQLRPVLVEIKKPRYRKRLPFKNIVKAQVRINFDKLFKKSVIREVKRATGVSLKFS